MSGTTMGRALSADNPLLGPLTGALRQPDQQDDTRDAVTHAGVSDAVRGNRQQITDTQDRLKEIDARSDALVPPVLQKPPPSPQTQATPAAERWGSVAMLLAGFGGLLTRAPLTASLNAMAQVNHAFNDGDAARAQSAYETWKVENANAIELNKFQVQAYDASLKKIGTDRAGALAEIRTVAAALKDDVVLSLLDSGQTDRALEILGVRPGATERMQEHAEKMADQHAAIEYWDQTHVGADPVQRNRAIAAIRAGKDPDPPPKPESVANRGEDDVDAVANEQIAQEEADAGGPLSDGRKAEIRIAVRAGVRAANRPESVPAQQLKDIKEGLRNEHPDWTEAQLTLEANKQRTASLARAPGVTQQQLEDIKSDLRTQHPDWTPGQLDVAANKQLGESRRPPRVLSPTAQAIQEIKADIRAKNPDKSDGEIDLMVNRQIADSRARAMGVAAQELKDTMDDLRSQHPDWSNARLELAANKQIGDSKRPDKTASLASQVFSEVREDLAAQHPDWTAGRLDLETNKQIADARQPTRTPSVATQQQRDIEDDLRRQHPDWSTSQVEMAANKRIGESKRADKTPTPGTRVFDDIRRDLAAQNPDWTDARIDVETNRQIANSRQADKPVGRADQTFADIRADLRAQHPDWSDGQLDAATNNQVANSRRPGRILSPTAQSVEDIKADIRAKNPGKSEGEIALLANREIADSKARAMGVAAAEFSDTVEDLRSQHPDWSTSRLELAANREISASRRADKSASVASQVFAEVREDLAAEHPDWTEGRLDLETNKRISASRAQEGKTSDERELYRRRINEDTLAHPERTPSEQDRRNAIIMKGGDPDKPDKPLSGAAETNREQLSVADGQIAAKEAQLGRPLTPAEKDQIRLDERNKYRAEGRPEKVKSAAALERERLETLAEDAVSKQAGRDFDPNNPDDRVAKAKEVGRQIAAQAADTTRARTEASTAVRNADGSFDQATIDAAVDQYQLTHQMPALGLGSSIARKQILEAWAHRIRTGNGNSLAADIARQSDIKSLQSSLTVLARSKAAVGNFEETAMKEADLTASLAQAGTSGRAPMINRWIQAGRTSIEGDPAVIRFNAALTSFKNEYARIMSSPTATGGQTTDAARAEADTLIGNAMTYEGVMAAIGTMKIGMNNRITAINDEYEATKNRIAELGREVTGGGQSPASQQGRLAPDGHRYIDDPNRPGKYLRVDP